MLDPVTAPRYSEIKMSNTNTAAALRLSITVVTPCTCGTDHGRKWWDCRTSKTVAEYTYTPEVDRPSEMDLTFIKNAHPGMDLIY